MSHFIYLYYELVEVQQLKLTSHLQAAKCAINPAMRNCLVTTKLSALELPSLKKPRKWLYYKE